MQSGRSLFSLLTFVALLHRSAAQGVTLVTATYNGNVFTFPYTFSPVPFVPPNVPSSAFPSFIPQTTDSQTETTRSRTRTRSRTTDGIASTTTFTPSRSSISGQFPLTTTTSSSSTPSQQLSVTRSSLSTGTSSSNGVAASGVNSPQSESSSGGGLSSGAKIGLGVGLGVGLSLILLGLLAFCLFRRRSKKQTSSSASSLAQESKAGEMSTSDLTHIDDRAINASPAPVLAAPPLDQEPTLPNLELNLDQTPLNMSQPSAGALAGTAVPFMGPNAGSTSTSPRGRDHVASAAALGSPTRHWDPRVNQNRYYSPVRESPSAGSLAGFDFGTGSGPKPGASTREQQFKIPRRPVRSNS